MSAQRTRPAHAVRARGPRPDPARGIFETLLVQGGRPVELEPHLARLRTGVRSLYGTTTPAGVRELAVEHAAGTPLGRLRVTVAPDPSGLPAASAAAAPVPGDDVLPGHERAATVTGLVVPGGLGPHKWADRRLLEAAASETGADLPVILDDGEAVLEASRASVFIVERGTITTPQADGRILPGVTRARVIDVAASVGLEVREEAVSLERLLAAEEVFLTGSVRGIEPVAAWRNAREWAAGAVTRLLSRHLRAMWEAQP